MTKPYTYQQQSGQGCLVVCLYYLFNLTPNLAAERKILSQALFDPRQNYALGVSQAFLGKNQQIRLNVASWHYAQYLNGLVNDKMTKNLKIQHQPINRRFLDQLELPAIIYVDRHELGEFSHQPHFIILLSRAGDQIRLFDPWSGKVHRRPRRLLEASVKSLHKHLKICPIVIERV